MAIDKNLLKQWFKSRAKPNQSQFWTWIDNIVFKGDKVPVSDVDGLSNTLNSLQLGINALQPNRVVNGGRITIAADDGTNVTIHLEDTDYELKGAPFSVGAQNAIITRPADETLSRFDVFYLDLTGFHVLTGVESEAPVKPQLLNGLELTTILIGFNNVLETSPMPGTQSLQSVTLVGNKTTLPIISKDSLQAGQAGSDIVGKIKADGLTADREYQLPDKGGTIALLSDIIGTANFIEDVIAGDNITIDKTDPKKPIINGNAGGGGGGIWGTITGDMSNQTDLIDSLETLQTNIDNEATARQNADDLLTEQIAAGASNAGNDLFNYYNF